MLLTNQLSALFLYQIFPLLNPESLSSYIGKYMKVSLSDSGIPQISSVHDTNIKWGTPSFLMTLTTDKLDECINASPLEDDREKIMEAVILTTYTEIHSKIKYLKIDSKNRALLKAQLAKHKDDVDHILTSLVSCHAINNLENIRDSH